MSHFTVLIIGPDVEEQLAPYYEQYDYADEEDRKYLVFKDDSEYKKQYEENKVLEHGEAKGKTLQQAYANYEHFLDDYAGLSIDTHTGKRGYWHNPNAKWDWYVLGGRWAGFFKMKKAAEGTVGSPGIATPAAPKGHADSAFLQDIDIKGMQTQAGKEAKERYERLVSLLGFMPKMEYLWHDIIKDGVTDAKRELYHNQTAKKLISNLLETITDKDDHSFLTWLDLEDYQVTIKEYIKKAKDSAFSTFAVVKDGVWYEKGKMGWWGCVSNEKAASEWYPQFNKLLADLPGDTLLSLVDCHI